MDTTNHTQTYANDSATSSSTDTELAQPRSRDVLRRELILMRNKHGAASPIGARCSNIVELIQAPELPTLQLERQMADLQRLLQDHQ